MEFTEKSDAAAVQLNQHFNRDVPGAACAKVHGFYGRIEIGFPTFLLETIAPINLFRIHEVALIQKPNLGYRGSPHHHKRTQNHIYFTRMSVYF